MFGVVMKIEKLFYQVTFTMLVIFTIQVNCQTTWYVNNATGSDQYDGLTISTPKKTIANAIFEASNNDTLLISDTGMNYGSETSEPDTICISKYLILLATGSHISISSSLEINIFDSLYDATSNVQFNLPFSLTGELILYNGLELNETLSLEGNISISENLNAPMDERKYCFNFPLLFCGPGDQVISIPAEGSHFSSFEIDKPEGDLILEGGNLNLSESCDSTFNNIVIFTKGLFLTGDNTLILKAPAGTEELGFIHQPAAGDVSHVVGTVGIEPKMDTEIEGSKTTWPVGSSEYFRPFTMWMGNTVVTNLREVVLATHIDEKPTGINGFPIEFEGRIYTYYPEFHWSLVTENKIAISNLNYDMEFVAEGFIDYDDINEVIGIYKYVNYYETEKTWFLLNNEFANILEDNIPIIRCQNTVGAFQRVPSIITFGLPTNLYTTGTLPDRTIMWEILQVDIEDLFAGSTGELTYSVSSSDTSHVRVSNESFTTTVFEVEGLVNGVSEICVTAADINGDFLSVYFTVTVDGHNHTGILDLETPSEYELKQNYPNPFNPKTTIRFGLPEASKVSLKIYNTVGEEVYTLVNGLELQAGYHTYNFEASDYPSGVYFYRLEAGEYHESRKMILMK